MKESLLTQLENMRKTLHNNIKCIKSLLDTSSSFTGIIESLKTQKSDEETLNSLQITRKSIDNSIDELIKNTNELFDSYDAMLKSV